MADSKPRYGSDLIVDLLKALGIEHVALNPGSSFRGIHDSLVNYNGNRNPEIVLCCHEEIAVSVAHSRCMGLWLRRSSRRKSPG